MFGKKKNKKKSVDFASMPMTEIVDGQLYMKFFTKNSRFLIFCSVLIFLYIGNRYGNEDLLRRISIAQENITRLRYKSLTISAQLMSVSRPSQVVRIVEEKNLGLKFSKEPPKVIE